MRRSHTVALVFASLLAVGPRLYSQVPPPPQQKPQAPAQQKPAQKPTPANPASSGANPFPEDTTSVPVMPTRDTMSLPQASSGAGDSGAARLPAADSDPVRSPDGDALSAQSEQDSSSSSSQSGLDAILPPSDDDNTPAATSKKRKLSVRDQPHIETAGEDVDVGKYYLESKNWRAALSRFQSAMVLDPENPEVYWGIAEADRHLGDFADARAYYQKLLDYDPDGPHGKDARKTLKDPQIANAKSPAAAQTAPAK